MGVLVVVGLTVVGGAAVVDGLSPGEADGEEVPSLQAVAITSSSPAIRRRRIDSTVRLAGQ